MDEVSARGRIMGAAESDAAIYRGHGGDRPENSRHDCMRAYWQQSARDERDAISALGDDAAWELYCETFEAELA